MRHLRLLLADRNLLPARPACGIRQHLRMTTPIERNKQERRLIHRRTARDHAVILQNDTPALPQRRCNARPFLSANHRPAVARIHSQIVVEAQCILVDHLDRATEAREGLAIHAVGVAGGVEVGARLVDLAVDGKGGPVDGILGTTRLDLAVFVDEHEVADFDLGEVRAEGVDPEVFWVQGVSQGCRC